MTLAPGRCSRIEVISWVFHAPSLSPDSWWEGVGDWVGVGGGAGGGRGTGFFSKMVGNLLSQNPREGGGRFFKSPRVCKLCPLLPPCLPLCAGPGEGPPGVSRLSTTVTSCSQMFQLSCLSGL